MATNTIDTTIWVTQQALADKLGVAVQNVHNWVQRGKIEWQYLPGSTTILVNKNTIKVSDLHHKRKNLQ
jgi:predicted site-specific integrase-resolvase